MNAKLKLCLSQTGRRQYQIAREVGLTENELSRIVRGRRPATADERRRLAAVLGIAERDLFGSEGPQLALAVLREADPGHLPPDLRLEEVPVAGTQVRVRRQA
jgi:transcriptional regulator with XRE-family HTH domain